MYDALRRGAARVARRSVLCLVGAVLLAVALAFLTYALWIALAIWAGVVVAAVILGGFYAVGGLVLLLLAREPPPPVAPTLPLRDPAPMGRIVAAFLEGMQAGVRARRRRGDP